FAHEIGGARRADDLGAVGGELQAERAADALRCAGDDRDLSVEQSHRSLLRCESAPDCICPDMCREEPPGALGGPRRVLERSPRADERSARRRSFLVMVALTPQRAFGSATVATTPA